MQQLPVAGAVEGAGCLHSSGSPLVDRSLAPAALPLTADSSPPGGPLRPWLLPPQLLFLLLLLPTVLLHQRLLPLPLAELKAAMGRTAGAGGSGCGGNR